MTSVELELNPNIMKPPANTEEFVTVLKVNNEMECKPLSGFVTVVELEGCKGSTSKQEESACYEEEVIMYRLPGERLGMGLKFEGGMQAFECVSHVYIQSVAPDSPAARTETSWRGLTEGDEILKIDGRNVNKMTRVDCVTILKKAPVAIKLFIRHGCPSSKSNTTQNNGVKHQSNRFQASIDRQEDPPPLPAKNSARPSPLLEIRGKNKTLEPPILPPPVPPRKLRTRKESSSSESSPPLISSRAMARNGDTKENSLSNSVHETPDGDGYRSSGILGMKLPGWEELMLRRSSVSSASEDMILPVPCDMYTDLIAEEDKRSLLNEYESDDTGSSASTVIERLSSAVTSVHVLTSEPVERLPIRNLDMSAIDLSQVLSPFEQLEKEMEVDYSIDTANYNSMLQLDSGAPTEEYPGDLTSAELPLILEAKAIEPPENFKDSNPELFQDSSTLPLKNRPEAEEIIAEFSNEHLISEAVCEMQPRNNNNNSECSRRFTLNVMELEKNALNSLSENELLEIQPPPKRKITPPPVPPRKLKNAKCTNSQEAINSHSYGSPDDDDLDDPSLTFPIIGNLLQELEQLPEFHRPNAVNSNNATNPALSICASSNHDLSKSSSAVASNDIDLATCIGATNSITSNNKQTVSADQDKTLQIETLSPEFEQFVKLAAVDEVKFVSNQDPGSSFSTHEIACHDFLDAPINSAKITSIKNSACIIDSEQVQCSYEEDDVGQLEVGGTVEQGQEQDLLPSTTSLLQQCNIGSCEVVAVIEKPSHVKHVIDRLHSTDKSMMANDAPLSTCLLLNCSDETFMPAFSRLPPDGHEFPPNYLESDGTNDMNEHSFALINSENSDKDQMYFEKSWVHPPVDFEGMQILMLPNGSTKEEMHCSNLKLAYNGAPPTSESFDDVSTASSQSSDTGDTVIYNEFPPPVPSMELSSEFSSADEDVFSGEETESLDANMHCNKHEISVANFTKETFKTEVELKRTPPIPPKRNLATAKPVPPPVAERTQKVEESLLSVKDKIALFVAKTELTSATPPSPPKPRAARRSLPIEKLPNDEVLNGSASNKTPKVYSNFVEVVEPVQEEIVLQSEPTTITNNKPHIESFTSSYNSSAGDYLHDRSGSSLSMSSGFSKSSDDLLSQDMDSSDVEDHTHPVAPSFDQKHHYQARQTAVVNLRPKNQDSKCGKNYWSTSSTDSDATESRSASSVSSSRNRSMYAILESRKQNVSKLKGLVIPHVQEAQQAPVAAAPELPLIFSVDSILLPKVELNKPLTNSSAQSSLANGHSPDTNKSDLHLMPRTPLMSNNTLDAQKYSPAFKRKPFTLADNGIGRSNDELDSSRLGKGELLIGQPVSKLSSNMSPPAVPEEFSHRTNSGWFATIPPPLPKTLPPLPKGKSVPFSPQDELPHFKTDAQFDSLAADAEDQESGISSIESPNVSIHNTPPGSPKDFLRLKPAYTCMSSSNEMSHSLESTASLPPKSNEWESNSSSTDSESSMDPRILKPNSVEAINRKNVLQSSRHSSGGFDEEDFSAAPVNSNPESPFSPKSFSSNSSSSSSSVAGDANHRKVSLDEKVALYRLDASIAKKEKQQPLNCSQSDASITANEKPVVLEPVKTVSDERWQELERKYGQKNNAESGKLFSFHKSSSEEGLLSLDRNFDKMATSTVPSPQAFVANMKSIPGESKNGNNRDKNFRALADRWEKKSTESPGNPPTATNMKNTSLLSKSLTSIVQNGTAAVKSPIASKPVGVPQEALQATSPEKKQQPSPLCFTNIGVTMRDKSISLIARPMSLLDTDTRKSKLWEVAFENASKLGRSSIDPSNHYSGKPHPSQPAADPANGKSRRSTSFNDLRQIFENQEMSLPTRKGAAAGEVYPGPKDIPNHMRMSSLDSTCSESDFVTPAHYGSATSLGSNPYDHYGSITSLASSTSLISPQELQQLIDEANQSLEESGTPLHEITVVVLQREIPGGSIGITLAGGADYDSKEITVNKVITGSLADRDGRIQKGDRVLSINGKNLKGVTHREALHILKAPRTDCVLVLSRSRSSSPQDGKENGNLISRTANPNFRNRVSRYALPQQAPPPPPSAKTSITCPTADVSKNILSSVNRTPSSSSSVITVDLIKDASGLGFSLDGGKDSPQGDKPLTIKKIFVGGAAHKNGRLQVGEEVLSINHIDVTKMSRIEAWSYMRKLPDGPVRVLVNHAK